MQRIGPVHGCSPSAEVRVGAGTMVFCNCEYNPQIDEESVFIRKFSIGMTLFTSGKQVDSVFELFLLSEWVWFHKRLFKVF